MKRTIAVAVLGAFCGSALATNGGQQLNAASANAAASAKASARATGVGVGTGGTAKAAGGAGFGFGGAGGIGQGFGGAGGNAEGGQGFGGSVNYSVPPYQTVTSNGRTQVETVPNVYAPNIYPTASCMGSSSAGAGWLGFGFSGGTSWRAIQCEIQEAARNAPTPADRIYVWCKSEAAQGAPSCAGLQPEPASTTGSIPVERERRVDATVKTGDPRTWGSY